MDMKRSLFSLIGIGALALSAACAGAKETDVSEVPVGADVTLTRQDGGVVEGKLAAKNEKEVTVTAGTTKKTTRTVPREEIVNVQVPTPEKPVELPPVAKFREYIVPDDMPLKLTLDTAVSSETSRVEDAVEAKLAEAILVDGVEVIPAGSVVRGTVASVTAAGKVKGRASLGLHFTTIIVRDERLPISARWAAEAASTKKQDATKIGIGAGAGALIGGIIGGGKGAAAGAAIGGGAGTAMVLTSEGKPIELAVGASVGTKLTSALEVKVPIK
jgi:hypothetical protein